LTIITLTTDFGTADPYVGAMKGVILSIDPTATIVDITHEVAPQAVEEAAFILSTVWRYFPERSIHLAVVDPGVGTDRKPVLLKTPEAIFVGPDNGILSGALPDTVRLTANADLAHLPKGFEAIEISSEQFQMATLSNTFHGRDIFAPAAGRLSAGANPGEAGIRLSHIRVLPPWRAMVDGEGILVGRVIHIDRFGNLITTIHSDQLPGEGKFRVEVGGRTIRGVSRTYAEGKGLMSYIGSAGFLEVGWTGGNVAAKLGVSPGDTVTLRLA
jgi:S-adenosylmethionine hydrolase